MNKNAKNWVKDLKSGEYKKTTGQLKRDNKFCCLGVACDRFIKENHLNWTGSNSFKGEYYGLPEIVRDWLGLKTNSGNFQRSKNKFFSLIELNDSGKSFKKIAAKIESEPKGLFNN